MTIKSSKLKSEPVDEMITPKKPFQRTFKKEDCFSTKSRLAKKDPVEDQFIDYTDHDFRGYSLGYGQKDFRV